MSEHVAIGKFEHPWCLALRTLRLQPIERSLMPSKTAVASVALLAAFALTSCGGDSSATSSESIDEERATTECTVLGGFMADPSKINAENIEEVKSLMSEMAETGQGAVKPTAAYVIDTLDGGEAPDADAAVIIEDFKDFCVPYLEE